MASHKILVVDDDEPVRRFIKACLMKAGHHVLEASQGVDAVLTAADQEIDLIITDVVMPGMNGLELAAYLSSYTTKRFLVISGHPEEVWNRGFQFGKSVGFLAKPFSPQVLLAKVNEVLGQSARASASSQI